MINSRYNLKKTQNEIVIIKSYNYTNWGAIGSEIICYNNEFILYSYDTQKYKEFFISNGSFFNHLPREGSLPTDSSDYFVINDIRLYNSFIYAQYDKLNGIIYEYQYPSFLKNSEYHLNAYFTSRRFLLIENNFWIIKSPAPDTSEQNYYLKSYNIFQNLNEDFSMYLGKEAPYTIATDNKRIYILNRDNTITIFGIEKNEYCEIKLPVEELFSQDRIGIWDFDYDGSKYFWFNERYSDTLFALDLLAITGFDYDNDGLSDANEMDIGTNIELKDTDNDTMFDGFENYYGFDPLDPLDGLEDLDNDGLNNSQEFLFKCDPSKKDTDFDGLSDYYEFVIGTDPNDRDSDGDGLIDGEDPRPAVPIRWWEKIGLSWPIIIFITVIFTVLLRKHHYNNS